MQQRNSRFISSLLIALLLNTFLAATVLVIPAQAAGINVTINQSTSGPVQADPTSTSPIVFRVVFSQAVSDFGMGDVDLSSSTSGGAGLSYTISGSGAIYNVSVTGMVSGYTVIATIPADVVSAGVSTNMASSSTDNSVFYETVKPTVIINQAAGQADPTNASPILYTAIFSEAVIGFTASDVSISGTAPGTKIVNVTEVAPNNGTTYEISVTGMSGSGTVIANIPTNAARDLAGNWSLASTSSDKTVTYNITIPTVTINQSVSGPVQNDPTSTSPIAFRVTFSTSMTGFGTGDVDLSGSTSGGAGLSYTISGSGAVYNVSVTGMVSGNTVVATIPASVATDAAGNANAASSSTDNSVLYETVKPTVTINQAVGQTDPDSSAPILFTAEFSENVTGFGTSDVTVGGSAPGVKTINIVPVDGNTYTVEISGMTGNGTVSAIVKNNAAQDAALNWSVASTSTDNVVTYQSTTLVVDTTADEDDGTCIPSDCSLREAIGYSNNGDTITFSLTYPATITLSTPIAINRDLTITGPDADKLTIQGTGTNRLFDGPTGRTITISGVTIAAGSHATLGAGIHNQSTLTLDKVVLTDNTAPSGGAIYNQGTLTITNSTLADNQATSGGGIYNTGILSITNSTLGINSASGQAGGIYNAVGATMTLLHTSIIDNPGGGIYNAGTLNYTSSVIAKNGAAGDCTLAGAGSLGINLNNFVGNASCSASLSGNPLLDGLGSKSTEPTDTFAPFSGSPLLNAANTGTCPPIDQRGVARPIGAGCDIGSFEGNRPSVTVNQAAGQADPTASGPILFTVVFGDPVTGFASNDVVLSGTASGTLTPVVSEVAPNNGTTYQISVTGMSSSGTVVSTIQSGAAQNTQGNTNGTPTFTDRTVIYDVTGPTVAVNQSVSGPVQNDPTKSSTIYFSVIFSEPVTGLNASELSFTGSTVSGTLSVASLQGSGTSYVAGVTGMTSGGLVVLSLPAGQATDLAGNLNTASTSTDNQVTYDMTIPTVTINQAGTQIDPTSTQPVVFTVLFTEAVIGFDSADIVLSGTAGGTKTVTVVVIDSQTYRIEITGITTGGTVIATVRPNAAHDAADNWSPVSTSTDNTVTYTP